MPAPPRAVALVLAAVLGALAAAGPAAGQGPPAGQSAAAPRGLRVLNATGGPLVYVHVADADGDWGAAVLDGDTLADGAARGFTVAHGACRYTLTAAAPDDALFTKEDVDLCGPGGGAVTLTPDDGDGATDGAADGTDGVPTITVLNEAGETAYTLFLRPSGGAAWGDDLLEDGVFEPGDTLDLPLPAPADGCRYDVRATDAEGTRGVLLLQLDVCDLAEIALPPFGPLPDDER